MNPHPQTIILTIPAGQPLLGLFAALRDRGLSIYCTGARSYQARERTPTTPTQENPK